MTRFNINDPQFVAKWAEENNRLKNAIAITLTLWTALEHAMAGLFAAVVEAKPDLAEVAFYSVPSTEGRIRMLDSVIAHKYAENDLIALMWGKISGKIASKKSVRNAIAHGAMATAATAKNGVIYNSLRIKPGFNDRAEWRKLAADTSKLLEAGLSANDIEGLNEAIGTINGHLSKLEEVVRTCPPLGFPSEMIVGGELPSLCRELGLALNVLVLSPNSQIGLAPSDPDGSPRAKAKLLHRSTRERREEAMLRGQMREVRRRLARLLYLRDRDK